MHARWNRSLLPLLGAVTAGVLVLARPDALAQERVELDLGAGVSLSMVRVPAGTFTMGSPAGEEDRKDDETAHEVTLTQDFYIGDAPVTRGQFARFVAETGYRTEAEAGTSGGHGWDGKKLVQNPRYTWRDPGFAQTDDHPVVLVTHDDALAFTRWLSGKTGREVTLPTEAQWEHAARGGSATPWFAAVSSRQALGLGWYRDNAGNGTREVKQRPANGFGLYEVAGNVWEWCLDWYGPYPGGAATDPVVSSPPGSETPRRVLRGGSWLTGVDRARSAARYRNTPGSRNADNGFRVVASVATAPATAPAALQDTPPPSMEGGAPSPEPEPEPGSTSTGPDASGFGASGVSLLLLFGGLGAGGVILAGLGLSRLRRRSARGSLPTRPEKDGFWLDASLSPGTLVRLSARLPGGAQTGEIEATGGPLFVYTGQPPQSVEAYVLPSSAHSSSGFSDHAGTSSSTTDPWAQQQHDAQAQATMAAATYHATYQSSHHADSSMSSGSSSESFGGWPGAY